MRIMKFEVKWQNRGEKKMTEKKVEVYRVALFRFFLLAPALRSSLTRPLQNLWEREREEIRGRKGRSRIGRGEGRSRLVDSY